MKPMKIMKERAEINQIKNKNYRKNNKTEMQLYFLRSVKEGMSSKGKGNFDFGQVKDEEAIIFVAISF